MAKVKAQCECCPNVMLVRQADINRGWGRFCSKSCAAYFKTFKKRKAEPTDLSLNGKRPPSMKAIEHSLNKAKVLVSAGLTPKQHRELVKAGCGHIRFEGDCANFSSRQLKVLGACKSEIREAEFSEAEEGAYGAHDLS